MKNDIRELGIDSLYRSMTNPKNKTFYIGNLTPAKAVYLTQHPENDKHYEEDFWIAFSRAQYWYKTIEEPRLREEYRQDILREYAELCSKYSS